MTEHETKKNIKEIIGKIKHPAIDLALQDLGLIKDVEIEDETVKITFAFPFPNIPIKDYLINSVKGPIEEMGISVEVAVTVMSQEELQKFLTLEKEHWNA
jgi:metal-sulfur cluster biosynthetic enzyme